MHVRFSEEDDAFRKEIAGWLEEHLSGEFEVVRGGGGPGDELALYSRAVLAYVNRFSITRSITLTRSSSS